MSGATKADLQVTILDLNAELGAVRERLTEVKGLLNASGGNLETCAGKRDHFKRQRDELIGYVEGTRIDREAVVPPDWHPEASRRTQLDQFLERMRSES